MRTVLLALLFLAAYGGLSAFLIFNTPVPEDIVPFGLP